MEGVERFGDPWEHIRLLSDESRNTALLELLRKRAPGARVLEVGCGTGLWSCIAARLGATEVYAVEPTAIGEVARELIAANGLADRVHLLQANVEELEPRPVDLAFSELLNADPFYEGVVEAMQSAATWLAPGGRLAPRRLKVYTQLVRSNDSAAEYRDARRAISQVGAKFGVEVGPLLEGLQRPGPYRYVSGGETLASEPVLLWDIALGNHQEPDEELIREVTCIDPGPIAGALVWFEADLGDGITMSNPPGKTTHWGQFVNAWPIERGVGAGGTLRIRATLEDDSVEISAVTE